MSLTYLNTVETVILYLCSIVPTWEPESGISTVIVIAMEVFVVVVVCLFWKRNLC